MSEHGASPAVQDAAKKADISLAPPKALNCELHDWRNRKMLGEWQTGLMIATKQKSTVESQKIKRRKIKAYL